jgi:hypothetical protein
MHMMRLAGAVIVLALGTFGAHAQSADIADLCKQRTPCSLVAATPAGTDAQGRALTVVELNLGTKNPDNAGGDERFDCRPYLRELWLRVAGAAEPRRLLTLCNDGYGAAGVGEDEIEVAPNRLVHTRVGGSAWRWDAKRTVQLSPLRVLEDAHCSYHNIAPGFTTTVWDWPRFSGMTRWTPKRCRGPETRDDEMGCVPERAARRYIPIPLLEGALAGKPLHLGSCAAALDESGRRGFILHGAPRAAGAELRALLVSPRELVVTVTDDGFAAGAASWVNDDHLELWLGHGRTGLECEGDKPANLRQWGIGLDGKVHAAHGNPRTPPRVLARLARKQGAREQVTLRLALPEEADGITIVYSKSANGRQARMVANSSVRRADATTLGAAWRLDPKAVACVEKDGALELQDSGLPAILDD